MKGPSLVALDLISLGAKLEEDITSVESLLKFTTDEEVFPDPTETLQNPATH